MQVWQEVLKTKKEALMALHGAKNIKPQLSNMFDLAIRSETPMEAINKIQRAYTEGRKLLNWYLDHSIIESNYVVKHTVVDAVISTMRFYGFTGDDAELMDKMKQIRDEKL